MVQADRNGEFKIIKGSKKMDNYNKKILGIHHITAIATEPQRNIEFYNGFLGLRLVKVTVNFDDPSVYHLYYGDTAGSPGTILTFFTWPGAQNGHRGHGQPTFITFSIPDGSHNYWMKRLDEYGVGYEGPFDFHDGSLLSLADPDGLQVELLAHTDATERTGWGNSPVDEEYRIRGIYSISTDVKNPDPSARFLAETLGFRPVSGHANELRFETGMGGPGAYINVRPSPHESAGMVAAGSFHHIAWRTPTIDDQKHWRTLIGDKGVNVTRIIDRKYFNSIYFREPEGVLFEIATDMPGFTVDERVDDLGSRLALPSWLEKNREMIEKNLPMLNLKRISQNA